MCCYILRGPLVQLPLITETHSSSVFASEVRFRRNSQADAVTISLLLFSPSIPNYINTVNAKVLPIGGFNRCPHADISDFSLVHAMTKSFDQNQSAVYLF